MQIFSVVNHVQNSLGPGERLCIYTLGCPRNCPSCESPKLKVPNILQDVNVIDIINKLDLSGIEGVTISGGDPFYQLDELEALVQFLSKKFDDILIYTGYIYEEIKFLPQVKNIVKNISVLIDGPYIQELDQNERLRGSTNQKIIYFKQKYKKLYEIYNCSKRQMKFYKEANGYVGLMPRDKEN